ncbi:nitroreductase family protein [Photobacterium carnosum]|uniref:nitroreductase family protein n=1 Tax=Photobacterium carnosum TaxID=2023717 RepID=UPI001E3114B4|nr:nitroreductase family protein [Photobacterium carnosum]MCD9552793.1 nitroreductase family protein [Photobacterium carnosum]
MHILAINSNPAEQYVALIHNHRSVRKYDADSTFDHQAVARALELATLSPNSSNMQLWQFNDNKRQQLATLCMGQNAAKTANELIAFVITPDKWQQRTRINAAHIREMFKGRDDKASKRALKYYEKLIPFVYRNDRFGLLGLGRRLICAFLGRNKPMMRKVSKADLRVCLHKSSSLAAMTFMMAMRAEGYDTCPMEGFDSKRAKALLGLKSNDEITMIVSCGKRTDEGIYGERQRVDNQEIIITHA